MDILSIPQVHAIAAGINSSSQLIGKLLDQLNNIIGSTDTSSVEFSQKKDQINSLVNNCFDKINNYRDELKNLLG